MKILQIIYQNGLRLLKLINDLLDLTKIDSGKMTVSYSKRDFSSFVRGIMTSLSALAEKKQIQLSCTKNSEKCEFYFDPDKIEKVILNLIMNALKFTPVGGQVGISWKIEGKQVEVAVRDTGIGIAKENLSKLFSRFSQVETSITRSYEGTGIGLALARELIELHQGKILARSELGKGTTITFVLPFLLRSPEQRPIKGEGISPEQIQEDWTKTLQRTASYSTTESLPDPQVGFAQVTVNGPKILLIEDNLDMTEFIIMQLKDHYQIINARNGVEGMHLASKELPSLILSDVMMPLKDGYQLCKEIKENHRTQHIPVILITAKAEMNMKLEGFESGADDYLTKPFSVGELRARISSLLKLRDFEAKLIHSEKMASVGLLVAGVAHEVNNPLNFANVHLRNLQRAVDRVKATLLAQGQEVLDEETRESLQEIPEDFNVIQIGLDRIKNIVQDLKTHVRKDEETFILTDLHQGLDSTLNLIKGEFINQIAVVREYGNVEQIEAIPGQLNQVFLNLIQNAFQAIPKGKKGEIQIKTWKEEDFIKVAIQDNGEGIPPENIKRVFDPFFTTKDVGQGTGLGLYICDQIIQKHGGRLEVESHLNKGTKMVIVLPVRQVTSIQDNSFVGGTGEVKQ
ncbi:MAG: ATP-binding protein [Nitrospiria bacterium]